LVLRQKPRNCCSDFEAQIIKHSCRFKAPNQETRATGFEAKSGETVAIGFEVKPEKTVTSDFEVKPEKTVTTGFVAKPEKPSSPVLRSNRTKSSQWL
jgi:hypothetical protein